jgi:peptidyl-prolyl cis-trans isomerase-like 4
LLRKKINCDVFSMQVLAEIGFYPLPVRLDLLVRKDIANPDCGTKLCSVSITETKTSPICHNDTQQQQQRIMALLLETLWGDLVIDLDTDGSPELCKNILKLAHARYYTNTLIFSVTAQRFCQLGCPVGDGTGGACIYGLIDTMQQQNDSNAAFDYRQSKDRFLRSVGRTLTPSECQEKGRVVATVLNHTADTIGSQFLITTASGPNNALDGYSMSNADAVGNDSSTTTPHFLSLGKVVEDDNHVIDKINAAYTDPNGRPYADIRIIRALVIYDPFDKDDIPGFDLLLKTRGVVVDDTADEGDSKPGREVRRVTDSPSPVRPKEETVPKRISAADVVLDDDSDDEINEQEQMKKRMIEQEDMAKKVDQSRAVVLEMIGDLPDADIRAPENVLFICKLNPATIDEDLELIFSRFDERVQVEIIRDAETGVSLQYAFAEFTNAPAAAEAYFKMNNTLVDDRRIKVDFSQSVSKLWDKYHQKLRMPRHPYNSDRTNMDRTGGGPNGNRTRSAEHPSQNGTSRVGMQQSSLNGSDLHQSRERSDRFANGLDHTQNDRRRENRHKDDKHMRPEKNHRHKRYDRDSDRRHHESERQAYTDVDEYYERKKHTKKRERHALDSERNDTKHVDQEMYNDRRSRSIRRSDEQHDHRRYRRIDEVAGSSDENDVNNGYKNRHGESERGRTHHRDSDEERSAKKDKAKHEHGRRRHDDDNKQRKRHKHSHNHRKRDRDSSKKSHHRSNSHSS